MTAHEVGARSTRAFKDRFVTGVNAMPFGRPHPIPAASSGILHWLSDYATLVFAVALTAIVLSGLQRVGHERFAFYVPEISRSYFPTIASQHLFRIPVTFVEEMPDPSRPLKAIPSTFQQELAMKPSTLLDRWNPFVAEASRRFHLSADWIRAVMRVESGGRTVLAGNQPMISHAGALGIMQLMPQTYRAMRTQYGLGANPFNPRDNVMAGAAYLQWLYRRYGFPNMFAAYNGGPGKLEDHLENGAPLPDETKNYVTSITHILGASEETAAQDSPRIVAPRTRARRLAAVTGVRHRGGRRIETTLRG